MGGAGVSRGTAPQTWRGSGGVSRGSKFYCFLQFSDILPTSTIWRIQIFQPRIVHFFDVARISENWRKHLKSCCPLKPLRRPSRSQVRLVNCPSRWPLSLAFCLDHLVGGGDPIYAAGFSSDHCWGLGWLFLTNSLARFKFCICLGVW